MDIFEGEAAGIINDLTADIQNGCSRDLIVAKLANRMRATAQAWQRGLDAAPRPRSATVTEPESDHEG